MDNSANGLITKKFELSDKFILKSSNNLTWNCFKKYGVKRDKQNDIIVELISNETYNREKEKRNYSISYDQLKKSTFSLVLLTLIESFELSQNDINEFISFKNARNMIAHKGDTPKGIDDLKNKTKLLFDNIIIEMMNKFGKYS